MSQYTLCPVGGTQGILVKDAELDALSDAMKTQALDGYIQLPGITPEQQIVEIAGCTCSKQCDFEHATYFERENGKHGWCCMYCGMVIQWG